MCGFIDGGSTKYIPTYGDRLAAKSFCRNSGIPGKKEKNISLTDSLRRKVKRLKHSTEYKPITDIEKANEAKESSDESDSLDCQKNTYRGKKPKYSRIIYIGCYEYMKDINYYKQIRKDKAGGPKESNKNTTLKDLLQTVIDLYFPNGQSVRDPLSNFYVKLTDVNFVDVEESDTVEALYNRAKMRTLRFNFVTTRKLDNNCGGIDDDDEDLPVIKINKKKTPTSEKSTTEDSENFEYKDGDISIGPTHGGNCSLDSTVPLQDLIGEGCL